MSLPMDMYTTLIWICRYNVTKQNFHNAIYRYIMQYKVCVNLEEEINLFCTRNQYAVPWEL
jgi:hypothetical protein